MALTVFWRVLMIIGLLTDPFRALNQVQVIRGRLDPKWSRYISDLSGPFYDESPPSEQTPRPPLTRRYNWKLSRLGESAFVAVIHRNTTDSSSVVSLDAGNACGGAVMTPNQVITLCACLATWHNWVKNGARVDKLEKPPFVQTDLSLAEEKGKQGKPYNLLLKEQPDNHWGPLVPGSVRSKYDIIADRIHVTHSGLGFQPDFRTRLDNRGKNSPRSTCPAAADDSDARLADVLVVSFVPGIEYPVGGQFMPWPPYPIAGDGQIANYTATVLGFGMTSRQRERKFYNEFGEEIPIENSTVRFQVENTQYNDCARNPDLWRTLPTELSTKVTCFRAPNRTFELCGGLVGNPVMLGGSIHGLMMSNISCEPSSVELLVLSFDSRMRRNIETWGGKGLRKGRNEDPLNAATDGKAKEVFYRDVETLKLRRLSYGLALAPGNTAVFLLMILASMTYQ